MRDRLDDLLHTVEAPAVDPGFIRRLRTLPLPARSPRFNGWQWLASLLPLPVAAAFAGFAMGVFASAAPQDAARTLDITGLIDGGADAAVVELMEDVLWPYERGITLASY